MKCHNCGSEGHLARDHTTGSCFTRLPNGVMQSLKQETLGVHVLSEVVNSLKEDVASIDYESDDHEVTDLQTLYALT